MAISSVCSVETEFDSLSLPLRESETTAAAAAGMLVSREPSVKYVLGAAVLCNASCAACFICCVVHSALLSGSLV